ncbi:uncharacterized protein J8A68_003014 [[Candida] subhashii]|uniref:J protein JJJ1 n=1 Tax=[Candida] subhashii TaxID=561895 RepID=A0A8J5UN68_9ASCO|nr:uncharacterized protein J8A68_003014 [[Candida] subhashii]KAG7663467.1 hypothetical protein J8A68_003014 [[Candida] subhashii]
MNNHHHTRTPQESMKTCYYELLGVESTATDQELKKAYRRKALQLHPDKNPDNPDEAHHQFSSIRAAYEVLSDPQERSWYDSHKSSILNEDNEEDYVDTGDSHIPSISTEEIYRFFNPSLFEKYDDSINGFYVVAGRLFERLAREEIQHGKYQQIPEYMKYRDDDNNVNVLDPELLKFPLFGNSKASYVDQVRVFYNVWGGFSTVKSFAWRDEYRYSTAPDRRTRRLMEKENKKLRDAARKEYNEVIKKFVAFIKRRDPRFKAGQEEYEKQRKKKQMEEYQAQLKQQAMEKLKHSTEFQEQDWQKLTNDELEDVEALLKEEYDISSDSEFDEFEDGEEELEVHEYECIICDKYFKNEQQFEIHEASKKHKKALRQMQWEMRKEGIDLGIDKDDIDLDEFETASSGLSEDEEFEELDREESGESDLEDQDKDLEEELQKMEEQLKDIEISQDVEVDDEIDSEDDNAYIPMPKKASEPVEQIDEDLLRFMERSKIDDDSEDDWGIDPKKSKKKKNKKVSREATPKAPTQSPAPEPKSNSPIITGPEKCAVCDSSFQTRNQLFKHIKSTGHAAPPTKVKKKKPKRK